jgi:hypothetical protein
MPRVGFETTMPAFERAKTVHALDRAATANGFARIQINNSAENYRRVLLQGYFLLKDVYMCRDQLRLVAFYAKMHSSRPRIIRDKF